MHIARSAIAGILALFAVTSADAQTYSPVPNHSVIGRIGRTGDSGPSQAIPFATLAAQLSGALGSFLPTTGGTMSGAIAMGGFNITGGGNAAFNTFNNVVVTTPGLTATLTLGSGKTATINNTLTFTGTDGSSVALGSGGTVLYNGGALGTPASGVGTNLTALNGSNITSGVVGATFGGAGGVTGALKGNGSGTVTQAACGDLSNATAACSTPVSNTGATIPLNNSNNNFSGTITHSGQFLSTFGTPTIASGACGTGTNGTISGTNQSGTITIGAAATTSCTVSFSATIIAPGACLLTAGNATAAQAGTVGAFVGAPSTTQWVITGIVLANTIYRYFCL